MLQKLLEEAQNSHLESFSDFQKVDNRQYQNCFIEWDHAWIEFKLQKEHAKRWRWIKNWL